MKPAPAIRASAPPTLLRRTTRAPATATARPAAPTRTSPALPATPPARPLTTTQPLMHRLAGHPELVGHLGHGQPADLHSHHCLIALLHFAELHEHSAHPLRSLPRAEDGENEVSSISRYRVN